MHIILQMEILTGQESFKILGIDCKILLKSGFGKPVMMI